MNFDEFGLAKPLLQAIEKEGYTNPTPIQQQSIPHILEGKDLLGLAQTGTGKTAAFALPILHKLTTEKQYPPRGGARILVIAPTRELSNQIADSFRVLGSRLKLSIHAIYGGVSYNPQIKAIQRGLDILVATPGRLIDHIERRVINLKSVEVLVLDEVDQMLDLGFLKPIRRIVQELPYRRQNLFFSATMPNEISILARELLNNPVQVSVAPTSSTAELIEQKVYLVERKRKKDLLVDLINKLRISRGIVFTRTKHGANKLEKQLTDQGITASAIHGNKSQGQREKTLYDFKKNKVKILVATDIAARGIDIEEVSHVINFDLPEVPEAYVHRIGRTARAGLSGQAIAFCDDEEKSLLKAIEKTIRITLDKEDFRLEETKEKEAAKIKEGSKKKSFSKSNVSKSGDNKKRKKVNNKKESPKSSETFKQPRDSFDPLTVPGELGRTAQSSKKTHRGKKSGKKPQAHTGAYGDNDSLRRPKPKRQEK